jgi:hypothetical protein
MDGNHVDVHVAEKLNEVLLAAAAATSSSPSAQSRLVRSPSGGSGPSSGCGGGSSGSSGAKKPSKLMERKLAAQEADRKRRDSAAEEAAEAAAEAAAAQNDKGFPKKSGQQARAFADPVLDNKYGGEKDHKLLSHRAGPSLSEESDGHTSTEATSFTSDNGGEGVGKAGAAVEAAVVVVAEAARKQPQRRSSFESFVAITEEEEKEEKSTTTTSANGTANGGADKSGSGDGGSGGRRRSSNDGSSKSEGGGRRRSSNGGSGSSTGGTIAQEMSALAVKRKGLKAKARVLLKEGDKAAAVAAYGEVKGGGGSACVRELRYLRVGGDGGVGGGGRQALMKKWFEDTDWNRCCLNQMALSLSLSFSVRLFLRPKRSTTRSKLSRLGRRRLNLRRMAAATTRGKR